MRQLLFYLGITLLSIMVVSCGDDKSSNLQADKAHQVTNSIDEVNQSRRDIVTSYCTCATSEPGSARQRCIDENQPAPLSLSDCQTTAVSCDPDSYIAYMNCNRDAYKALNSCIQFCPDSATESRCIDAFNTKADSCDALISTEIITALQSCGSGQTPACTNTSSPAPNPGTDPTPQDDCSVICNKVESCFTGPGGPPSTDCHTRCKANQYNSVTLADPTISCLKSAGTCPDVKGCLVQDSICDEVCQSLLTCNAFDSTETCKATCGVMASTGQWTSEQIDCLNAASSKDTCHDIAEMCLYGRRDSTDAACGIYPQSRCWGMSGCSCDIAWRPCDPRVACMDCQRACMKFTGCVYGGQANTAHRAECMAGCEGAWSKETIQCFADLPSGNIMGNDCDSAQMQLCLGY